MNFVQKLIKYTNMAFCIRYNGDIVNIKKAGEMGRGLLDTAMYNKMFGVQV